MTRKRAIEATLNRMASYHHRIKLALQASHWSEAQGYCREIEQAALVVRNLLEDQKLEERKTA